MKVFIFQPLQQKQNTLGKKERLKSRKLIDELFSTGHSFSNFPFRVIWKENTKAENSLQAAFSASSRSFKKATDRNRIKRLMREAWRLQKQDLKTYLDSSNKAVTVFIIYTGNELPLYKQVAEKMEAVIKRLLEKNRDGKN